MDRYKALLSAIRRSREEATRPRDRPLSAKGKGTNCDEEGTDDSEDRAKER